jgi:transcriptional regulator
MYLPKHFDESDTAVLHATMAAHPLATLVTLQDGLPCADEVPFVLDAAAGTKGTLRAHVARSSPLWQRAADTPVLVIFRGPQTYVSPSWYPSKTEHGKVVPTWNYVIVQARGRLRIIDQDPLWLRAQIETLTRSQEDHRATPWHVHEAPPDYLAQMMAAIVGIEISIETLTGKTKVSQNRSIADRAGVAAGLHQESGDQAAQMAQLVQQTLVNP